MARTKHTDVKTFTKDGKTRVAYSAADAVALRFDGWVEQETSAAKPTAAKSAATTPPTKAGSDNR